MVVPVVRGIRTTWLLVAAVASVAAATFASAAPATTGAELVIPMRVTLTDRGIHFSARPRVDLDTTVLFLVTNRSSGRRWFQIGGPRTERRTRVLRHGATDRFYFVFRVRGRVPYKSGGPSAPVRAGTFRVS
jgi:hypothetical protein